VPRTATRRLSTRPCTRMRLQARIEVMRMLPVREDAARIRPRRPGAPGGILAPSRSRAPHHRRPNWTAPTAAGRPRHYHDQLTLPSWSSARVPAAGHTEGTAPVNHQGPAAQGRVVRPAAGGVGQPRGPVPCASAEFPGGRALVLVLRASACRRRACESGSQRPRPPERQCHQDVERPKWSSWTGRLENAGRTRACRGFPLRRMT